MHPDAQSLSWPPRLQGDRSRRTRLSRRAGAPAVLAAVTLVLALAVAGCGADATSPDTDGAPDGTSDGASDGRYDEGCGRCSAELGDIRQQVQELPGVTRIYEVSYGQTDNDLRRSALSLQVGIRAGAAREVDDAVTEIVWKSDLTPVESLVLVMAPPAPADIVDGGVDLGADLDAAARDDFERRWGPRPVD